jgi:hypothetical protein
MEDASGSSTHCINQRSRCSLLMQDATVVALQHPGTGSTSHFGLQLQRGVPLHEGGDVTVLLQPQDLLPQASKKAAQCRVEQGSAVALQVNLVRNIGAESHAWPVWQDWRMSDSSTDAPRATVILLPGPDGMQTSAATAAGTAHVAAAGTRGRTAPCSAADRLCQPLRTLCGWTSAGWRWRAACRQPWQV